MPDRGTPYASEAALVLGAGALATVAAALVLELWRARLDVPWAYSGDGISYGVFVKGILDHGWHYTNPSLAAPGVQELYDWPILSGENLQALIVKLLGLGLSDWATVTNVYFLLTFPLAAMTAVVILRRLGSARGPALVCAVLFALLPYHFARGQNELFIVGYFAVPFGAYLVLTILKGEALFARRSRPGPRVLSYCSRRSLATVGMVVAIVGASASYYYSSLTVVMVAAATLLAALVRRRRQAVVSGAVVLALLTVGVVATLAPSIAYRIEHGPNEVAGQRGVSESEIFALKLTQLVLPIEDHRLSFLGRRSASYAEAAPFGELGRPVHLGLVASLGFAWLLVVAVASVSRASGWKPGAPYHQVATANLLAFLIGTVGGVSALIAATLTPQLRAWNRISVFIGFFALVAVGLGLSWLGERLGRETSARAGFAVLLGAILTVGVLEQTSPASVPAYATIRSEYESDAHFVAQIERVMPRAAAIYQLPYVQFPEAGLGSQLGDYDLARPYLHSDDLRWSFGAMKGRPSVPAALATERVERLLPAASRAGYEGLYIDRAGYPDRAARLEAEVSALLGGVEPLVSDNGRMSFFDLRRRR